MKQKLVRRQNGVKSNTCTNMAILEMVKYFARY